MGELCTAAWRVTSCRDLVAHAFAMLEVVPEREVVARQAGLACPRPFRDHVLHRCSRHLGLAVERGRGQRDDCKLVPQLGWLASRARTNCATRSRHDRARRASRPSPDQRSSTQYHSISTRCGKASTGLPSIVAGQDQMTRSIDQLAAGRCYIVEVLQGGHAACILCRMCREADRQQALGRASISTEAPVPLGGFRGNGGLRWERPRGPPLDCD